MQIKLCPQCKRPYLTREEFCPRCPPPYEWNQESWMNAGCLVATVLPLFLMILFWLFFFLGIFMR